MIQTIRQKIGFKGLLMTDDLGAKSMQAGDRATLLRMAQAAGNDIIQYTFGLLDPASDEVFVPEPNAATGQRIRTALQDARTAAKPCDTNALQSELDDLLARYAIKVGA